MITKERIESIGDVSVKLTSDFDNGQYFNTKVEINAGVLCWVSGDQRLEFLDEINAVIQKYRI